MRIGVGLHLLAPDNGGVTNYTLTLLRLWPEFAPEHPLILFSFPHNDALLATLPPSTRRHEIRLRTQEEVTEHFDKIDVYFCPFGTLWPRPVKIPSVLTFHDMQERFYPEHFSQAELTERFFHYDWSLRMADAVVTISNFTRQMATRLTGISGSKCQVVHHVPDELPPFEKPHRENVLLTPGKFFFYPANFWRHKNHRLLLKAFAEFSAGSPSISLVCTGSLLKRESEWDAAVSESGLNGRVHHLGKVSRREISWLFHHALALVFPSLFEGFGIPLIEAMQAQCPIVCGNNTSQPEVAGNAALYFDASDVASLSRALSRITLDAALRERLVARGTQRLAEFTVERFIRGHLLTFQNAIRRHTASSRWINEQVRERLSHHHRSTLTQREKRTAAALLAERAHLPAQFDSVLP